MNHEIMMLVNDIERMSESLQKLIKTSEVDPKNANLKAHGLNQIRRGTAKVVNSLTRN